MAGITVYTVIGVNSPTLSQIIAGVQLLLSVVHP